MVVRSPFLGVIECCPSAGYSPDAVSYTTLIRALSWLGRSNDALQAFEELDANPNAQADLYAYNAIISALSVAGRMEDAEKYLQHAAQLAQNQGEPAPVEAFGAIIKVCSFCCLLARLNVVFFGCTWLC